MQILDQILYFFRSLKTDNKDKIYKILTPLRFLISFLAISSFIIYYGFSISDSVQNDIINFNRVIFGFFIASFGLRVFFSDNFVQYIIQSWFEFVLILILIYDVLSFYLFGQSLIDPLIGGVDNDAASAVYILLLQLYMLLLAGIELIKFSSWIGKISLKPAVTFIFSFIILILVGTSLLMLPEMNITGKSMNFVDALFTSASASCVTGLIVVDTANFFTFKGQLVILILMQFGGIGILSFATFFAYFLKKGVGIKHQSVIRDFLSEDSLFDARKLLSQIILFTLSVETLGVIAMYNAWENSVPFYDSFSEKLFFSLFHTVSAFCNAGFSLFPNGFYDELVRDSYLPLIILGGLIFTGSLGFPALRDIFSIQNMRKRMETPWLNYKLSTQIAIKASVVLVLIGSIVFLLLENDRVLANMPIGAKIIHSIFQSLCTRSAGYNSVDIGSLGTPTIVFFIFLMFIGASSGSTGGGIKTSTFVIIFMAVFSTIRGKKSFVLNRRTISTELVNKAYTIFLFSSTFILFAVFILSISDGDKPILDLVFEEVSAFCTVGMSRGITSDMSIVGKIVLTISMFIGRVGTLTLAFALASPVNTNDYRYPNAHMLVG